MKKAVLLTVGLTLFAAGAHAQPACLQAGRIWSWKPLDSRTLVVQDRLNRNFMVNLMGHCPALTRRLTVGFRSNGLSGLDCLRRGDSVISRDVRMRFNCPIRSIVPWTPQEQRAYWSTRSNQGNPGNQGF